uniref:CST complex subunit CTC1 n=1 Tax=Echinococcus granulosus TaxID=6210 RepID=A0A068X158_ECHGR|nr:hypothetical protein EgrG_000924800 [Echinococcus granulosus]
MAGGIEGFIQFRSPVFTVGASHNTFVKVTTSLNCLCTKPIYNVLITHKPHESESFRVHREAFIASLDRWMHQRVRFHGLDRATLFSGQLNEATVWRYVPERSTLQIVLTGSNLVPSTTHICPNWPTNLLPCIDLNVTGSYRHFCAVECYGCGNNAGREAFLNTHSFSSSPLSPGLRIRVFGLWIFGSCYLQPGIFTSWRSESGSLTTFPSSPLHLDVTSPADSALRLALMKIFTPPLDAMDSDCQEKASLWAESAFNALFDNVKRIETPPAIRFADKFIRPHEHAPSPHLGHRLLTTGDLNDVSSAFQSAGEPINLSGRTFQFFEPRVTPQETILIGRLGMEAVTGALTIGPVFISKQSASVPLLLLSPSMTDLGMRSLFNEVVLIRRPRLVVAAMSSETSTVVRAFGRCLATLPRLCVICDAALKSVSVDTVSARDPPSLHLAEVVAEPILLRYVSSPTNPPTSFTIRYESARGHNGNSNGRSSSSLHHLELHSSAALWAFASGLFNIGHRIHLCCACDGGSGPRVVSEPKDAPWSSACHHLVGLYHWRILSVKEVLDLLKVGTIRNREQQKRWISIQGYVLRHEFCAPNGGDRQSIRLWLIDRHSIDPCASSPLCIDFFVPNSTDTRATADLFRLPCLTHICLFKVRLRGRRLFLPLSPNRLQVSPNGLYSYFSTDISRCFCSCFPGSVNNPVCSVCTMHESMRTTTEVIPSALVPLTPMNLLYEAKGRKTCLVHIIRCLKFNVFRLEGSVNVQLKILVTDGSATGVVCYNFDYTSQASCYPRTAATPSLQWLVALLGLEEPLTLQVLTHLSTVSEDAEDPVRVGLGVWFDSPGFLRPISLTLEKDITNEVNSYWRLNTVFIGREVRLPIAPVQKFHLTCC